MKKKGAQDMEKQKRHSIKRVSSGKIISTCFFPLQLDFLASIKIQKKNIVVRFEDSPRR